MSNKDLRRHVTLTVTEACNLKCTYCYENNKSPKTMSFETAKSIIDREFADDDGMDIEFDFFGGEPFLNFDLIKQCSEYIWGNSWNGRKYICYASTNGTLIHGEIKEWLRKNRDRFWCSLSLDGTKQMHDTNRCNSFDLIDIDFFLNNWQRQPVKMTISRATLPNIADGIIFLHSKGFEVHANPACGIDWDDPKVVSILSEQLKLLIDYYLANPSVKPCSMLDRRINALANNEKNAPHKWCGTGVYMRTYSCDGVCYPCQFFMPISIGEEKAKASLSIDFTNIDVLTDHSCSNCPVLAICPTCYGSNYMQNGDVAIRDKQMCKLTKATLLAISYFEYKKLEPLLLNRKKLTYEQIMLLKSIRIVQSLADNDTENSNLSR